MRPRRFSNRLSPSLEVARARPYIAYIASFPTLLEQINKRKRITYDTRHCEERSDVAIQTAAWIATSLRSSQ
jgi:hypothetical protein